MTWWTDIPVRRKLTLVILLTCTTVLLLACAALAAYEFITFRRTMARDMTVLADVLSRNITSALAFQDESEALKNAARPQRRTPNHRRLFVRERRQPVRGVRAAVGHR